MDPEVDWDDLGIDDMPPTAIGDILPAVLASYGLGEPPLSVEEPVLCGDTAPSAFAMAEVS